MLSATCLPLVLSALLQQVLIRFFWIGAVAVPVSWSFLTRASAAILLAVLDKTEIDLSSGEKRLLMTMSSDRGLCGGIHSYQAKMVHKLLAESPVETRIVSVGDKTRGILGVSDLLSFI